jgi:hypothetical protein
MKNISIMPVEFEWKFSDADHFKKEEDGIDY